MKKTGKISSISCSLKGGYSCTLPVVFFLFFYFIPVSGLIGQQQSNKQVLPDEVIQQVENTLKTTARTFEIIENKGQENLPDQILGYFSTGSQVVFIEKDRLRVIVITKDTAHQQKHFNFSGGQKPAKASVQKYSYNNFEIRFKGAAAGSKLENGKSFASERFFNNRKGIGTDNINVSSHEEVILKNIYPNTDLRIYSQADGQLEFDWILWPGADLGVIQLNIAGSKGIQLQKDGSLNIALKNGDFRLRLPESYYVSPAGKLPVNVSFNLKGKNDVGFKMNGKRRADLPLVVDPDLLWGTFFDGNNALFDEYLYAIEYNPWNGLIYCAGVANLQVSSVYAAALSSGWSGSFVSSTDVLVYALTANGQSIKYITYIGGNSADLGIGLSVYQSSVFVCGYTSSSDYPVTSASAQSTAAFDNSYNSNTDGFVSVLNDSLNRMIYSTYLGSSGTDQSFTIRAHNATSFTVSMQLTSALPAGYLTGAADNSFGGTAESWIGRFRNFNTLFSGTYIGGTDFDWVNDFQVLSDSSIVFAGYTKLITEINSTVSQVNGTKYDGLFGHLHFSPLGVSSFSILEKFGGSGSDQAWGIYSLGDSVSIVVGQTSSTNLPLGSGSVFQSAANGAIEGFVARFNNDGTGNYKASYVGGSGNDILVTVRPIFLQGRILLMSFGSTESTNLPVLNFNAETFYSSTNAGGLDMMFLITDLTLSSKYYLSYIGGSGNDYLGKTGAPFGSNHMYYDSQDSVLYVGTTTHSSQTTHSPAFVGRGLIDIQNAGVPVFDQTKANGTNDTHIIFGISTKSFIEVVMALPLDDIGVRRLSDCTAQIHWSVLNNDETAAYDVERSKDGVIFESIAQLQAGNDQYVYSDHQAGSGTLFYRIRTKLFSGRSFVSEVRVLAPCTNTANSFSIYPTQVHSGFTLLQKGLTGKSLIVSGFDISGRKVQEWHIPATASSYTCNFNQIPAPGMYILSVAGETDMRPLFTQKIVVY